MQRAPGEPRAGDIAATVSPLDAARDYVRRGCAVIPIPHGKKAPREKDWPNLRLSEADLPARFSNGENIGVLLGEPSGGLVDTDLDAPEAAHLASKFLPATDLVHGRASKRESHFWYRAVPAPRTERFTDVDGSVVAEIRSDGCQTVVPPSRHPSQESIQWERQGEPATVEASELRRSVATLASAALLVRHWPAPGSRHNAALALGGMLLRGGWSEQEAESFVRAVCEVARDEESKGRIRSVISTAKRLAQGRPATGTPTLAQILGSELVARLCDWLGLKVVPGVVTNAAPSTPSWPEPLAPEAFYGLVGDVVRTIEPHTEADPAALLLQFLGVFGNVVGHGPYFRVEADRHTINLFVVLVGMSAKGRKGSAWGQIEKIFRAVDPAWAEGRVMGGLSSGEGLIWNVRDAIDKHQPVREHGHVVGYETVVEDPGIADKRLLVFEPEFAGVLRVLERQGSTISTTIRQAWDRGDLRVMTKNSPARATGAHISVIGHVTRDEALRYLTATQAASGFANRFLWTCVRRSKQLPEGGHLGDEDVSVLVERVKHAVEFSRTVGELRRDDQARAIWNEVYGALTEGRPGLSGAVISRAEAQVVRLSLIFALLDCSTFVRAAHLRAALAVWEFAEASARFVFGDSLGDPDADLILRALRDNPHGLTRTQIRDLFDRHRGAEEIQRALTVLAEHGLAQFLAEDTAGRPVERWITTSRSATEATKAT